MKSFAILAVVGVAVAQTGSSCANTCITNMQNVAQTQFGCRANDAACYCADARFAYGVRDCASQYCPSQNDIPGIALAIANANSYCGSALSTAAPGAISTGALPVLSSALASATQAANSLASSASGAAASRASSLASRASSLSGAVASATASAASRASSLIGSASSAASGALASASSVASGAEASASSLVASANSAASSVAAAASSAAASATNSPAAAPRMTGLPIAGAIGMAAMLLI